MTSSVIIILINAHHNKGVEMSERGPVIYGLEAQGRALTARALTARAGETEKIHFFCGTQSLRQENQVHLLEYDEERGILDKTVHLHSQGEIW